MKRILSAILCAVIIALTFCACSQGEKEEEKKEEVTIKTTFDSAYASTDRSAVNAYETLCNAVLDYQSDVRMNTALFEDATQLFYTSFPLYPLVKDIKINDDNSGITLTYLYEKEEHNNKINAFRAKTDEIIKTCSEGTTNKGVFTVNLYNYIAKSVVLSEDETVTCLDTVLNGKGSSFSYAQLFEYILRQKDIDTYHVIASDAVGKGWGIAGAVIYDNIYYFDIMSEYYDNQGTKLVFFGMTNEDLKNEGLRNMKLTNQLDAPDASDLMFDACRKCDKWELDGTKLLITYKTEEVVEIAL